MKESSRKKMGRKPKADPAIHRYGIKLTNEENVRFEAAFSESGMKEKAGFIKKSIFGGRIKGENRQGDNGLLHQTDRIPQAVSGRRKQLQSGCPDFEEQFRGKTCDGIAIQVGETEHRTDACL